MTLALLSVSDKTGIVDFARELHALNIKIISTGGTATLLAQAGIPVQEVADYTGFPEMLDGRVKTLHPKIHGGLLGRRDLPEHQQAMAEHHIAAIDLVVVNLYPFAATITRPDCCFDDAIENIDIGGPAMLRSAAKNHAHVTVVVDPSDYENVIHSLKSEGKTALPQRLHLAKKVFAHTAAYDGMIANYLTRFNEHGEQIAFPGTLNAQWEKVQDMRYGENPHQHAAFYKNSVSIPGSIATYAQHQGKELSFNNVSDADTAWECVKTLPGPACVIVKHANPCGVAVGTSLLEAYQKAHQTDSTSAFGGIIAFNEIVTEALAKAILQQFVEVIIAPAFDQSALHAFSSKPNIRLLTIPLATQFNPLEFKNVNGGLLVQTPDSLNIQVDNLKIVTQRQPTTTELETLLFAWKVAKFVKSNAIVFCRDNATLGIGAGQMSRVDSVRIAASKAANAGLDLTQSAVASDAFFPFRDGVDVLAATGATTIIQPGGSLRDEEVIQAANEYGLAMVFTGVRHFRH